MEQYVENISKEEKTFLMSFAKGIFIFLILLATVQLFLTLMVPVNASVSRVFIYARNFSSVALLYVLAIFFNFFASRGKYSSRKKWLMFKIITLLASLACLVKAVLTMSYFYFGFVKMDLIGIYYIGEIIFCLLLAAFLFYYFIMLTKYKVGAHFNYYSNCL